MARRAVAAADWLGLSVGPGRAGSGRAITRVTSRACARRAPWITSVLTTPDDTLAALASSAAASGFDAAASTRARAGVRRAGATPEATTPGRGCGLAARRPRRA